MKKYKLKDEMQKLIDEAGNSLEQVSYKKEKEIAG